MQEFLIFIMITLNALVIYRYRKMCIEIKNISDVLWKLYFIDEKKHETTLELMRIINFILKEKHEQI